MKSQKVLGKLNFGQKQVYIKSVFLLTHAVQWREFFFLVFSSGDVIKEAKERLLLSLL